MTGRVTMVAVTPSQTQLNTHSAKNLYQRILESVRSIQSRTSLKPQVGVILGSGLGALAEQATDSVKIPYTEIPNFYGTSVEGHSGHLVVGKIDGVPVVFLQGRFHRYEGYPMDEVVFPTRVICAMGIHTLLLPTHRAESTPSTDPAT